MSKAKNKVFECLDCGWQGNEEDLMICDDILGYQYNCCPDCLSELLNIKCESYTYSHLYKETA